MRIVLILPPGAPPAEAAGAAIVVLVPGDPRAASVRALPGAPRVYVHLEPDADLDAAMALRPDGVLAPVEDGRALARLGSRLAVSEAELGLPDGVTRVLALAATARAVLGLGTLAGPRLAGIAWDPDALADGLGLAPHRDPAGARISPPARAREPVAGPAGLPGAWQGDEAEGWPGPLAQARGLVVLAAAAARVPAFEAVAGPDLAARMQAARRDGLAGVIVRDPAALARPVSAP